MPNQLANQPLNFGPELAGVPYLDQYFGSWAIEPDYAKFLVSHAQNINLQVHLENQASQASAGGSGRRPSDLYVDDNGIAHIELEGTLMKHCSSMAAGTSMSMCRRQVRAAAASPSVRGILVHVDSPGGTVFGTADLAADLRAAGNKKPLFAFIEDCGASGAYWLASQATRVSATPTTLVGSIGVFHVVEDTSKAAEAEGVKVHVVRFGAMKGAGTPGTPVTEEQLAHLQERVDGFAQDFISAIASGRRMTREQATALADGRIHKGAAAKQLGLIDAVESIDETYRALVAETNKPNPKTGSKAMSEQSAETKASEPVAATIAELKDNCPGASSEFLVAQLEKKATVAEAMKAHTKQLADDKAKLAEENAELKAAADAAKITDATKQPAKRGAAPLASGDGEPDADQEHAWSLVGANAFQKIETDKRVAAGQNRTAASNAVFAANEGLREAMVAEAEELRRKRGRK